MPHSLGFRVEKIHAFLLPLVEGSVRIRIHTYMIVRHRIRQNDEDPCRFGSATLGYKWVASLPYRVKGGFWILINTHSPGWLGAKTVTGAAIDHSTSFLVYRGAKAPPAISIYPSFDSLIQAAQWPILLKQTIMQVLMYRYQYPLLPVYRYLQYRTVTGLRLWCVTVFTTSIPVPTVPYRYGSSAMMWNSTYGSVPYVCSFRYLHSR